MLNYNNKLVLYLNIYSKILTVKFYMYKKTNQPPTPNINNNKKSTKITERPHINSVDKKNDTTNNDFKNRD